MPDQRMNASILMFPFTIKMESLFFLIKEKRNQTIIQYKIKQLYGGNQYDIVKQDLPIKNK